MAIYIHTTQILNNFIFSIISSFCNPESSDYYIHVKSADHALQKIQKYVNKLLCSALATIHVRFMNNDH